MKLKLLTWDVKDTLVKLRRSVGEQYFAEAQRLGIPVEPSTLNTSFKQVYRVQTRQFPNYGLKHGLSSQQWWVNLVKQTFKLCGVLDDKLLTSLGEALYHDFCTEKNWEVLPGVPETLDHCHKLGLRMAVISNFDNRLEQILQHCRLRHHFELVMTSEKAGVAKPDIRIFQKALSITGITPDLAGHIGDDYVNDYRAAREAGMQSFLVCSGGLHKIFEKTVPQEHLLSCPQDILSYIK